MKKIVVFILALSYLFVSTGATVHLSYCMGELVNKGLINNNSKTCSYCGMDKKDPNGCCKEESRQIKLANDQTEPKPGLSGLQVFASAFPADDVMLVVDLRYTTSFKSQNFFPPPENNRALYLRNCVFRI